MRIAIITDIHEDFQMLEKASALLKSTGYDIMVCLGDITGYTLKYYNHSPDANACIDFLRQKADIVLAGNHDMFTCRRLPSYHPKISMPVNWYGLSVHEQSAICGNTLWLYEDEVIPELTKDNLDFLKNLKEYHALNVNGNSVLFSHFVQPDLIGAGRWFPHYTGEIGPHLRFMRENNCNMAFTGHFHPEGVHVINKFLWTPAKLKTFRIKRNPAIVLCLPLTGGKNTGFIIFDSVTNEIIPCLIM